MTASDVGSYDLWKAEKTKHYVRTATPYWCGRGWRVDSDRVGKLVFTKLKSDGYYTGLVRLDNMLLTTTTRIKGSVLRKVVVPKRDLTLNVSSGEIVWWWADGKDEVEFIVQMVP